ncbi:hypothetical protein B0181_01200 [Moraxella caviae]|uniref:NADH-flavin reductase n=1 Tax=Moraxella caviae TaxID=34060 RepID=A0A1T0AAR8_9GAMM|nr:NAD(P)H-binding protein [Moraxella caviae]OOR92780.1 hypothetical protein B0181_01200 [Moraxella caviae]STZ14183.1 Putative NADH-flavin reductase [Moraxella caviae]VEW12629.1 Putative NADH-flavin reductase [Moraxella caviae]
MHALIIGATGATGSQLLTKLLADPAISHVTSFVRKDADATHPKLTTHVIDFNDVASWQEKVVGDVLFCCLGTTKRAAGSQQAQWKIDHDYPLAFAKAAKNHGVPTLALISSDGADARSPLFYYRMKGALDDKILALGFKNTLIFRPPLLKRPNSDRLGENLAEKAIAFANRFGLLKSAKPMAVADLAQAMLLAVKRQENGIIDKNQIRKLLAN